jgi:hypothetical protein
MSGLLTTGKLKEMDKRFIEKKELKKLKKEE